MTSSMQDTGIGQGALPHPTKSRPQASRFRRVLREADMALFTVCAILFLDQLTVSASMGVQSISWWLLTLVFFFIPYGLITAELGSTYTEEGGIYAWVRRAFGPVWAGRAAWLWWVSVAVWLPSVCILFVVIFSDVFVRGMGQWTKVLMIIALIWLTVSINIVKLDLGKWVPNLGSIFKAVVMLALGIGGILYASSYTPANDFSKLYPHPDPTWGFTLAFYPIIVYNFLGFELMSGAAEEMQNPARDVPLAIVRSGVIIAFFYLFATVGMLLVAKNFPSHLADGLPYTFRCMFGTAEVDTFCTLQKTAEDEFLYDFKGADNALVIALCLMSLYTFVANMVTWGMGANRSAAEAANRGDLPSMFEKLHPTYRTPANSAVLCGLISTLVLFVFLIKLLLPENFWMTFDLPENFWTNFALPRNYDKLFWETFSFSLVVFLFCYLFLFASFLKLRWSDPNMPRPYRVPGGSPIAVLLTIVCTLFILAGICILVFIDAYTGEPNWYQAAWIGGLVAFTLGMGEWLVRRAQSHQDALAKV